MKTGEIFFVRHGESVANELNIFSGTCDVPLTTFGREQARKAGQEISRLGLKFDEVHRSELIRVKATSEIVLAVSGNDQAPVFVSADLNERDFGEFTGRNKTLLRRAVGYTEFENAIHSFGNAPPNGESLAEIYARVKVYYEQALVPARDSGKTVLVVCSKYIIEMFALVSLGLTAESYFDFKLPNSKPLSEASLKTYVQAESHSLKEFADRTSYHSTLIVLGAALAGVGIKAFTHGSISPLVYGVVSALSLAVMTFFSSLILDLRKALNTHALLSSALYWVLRVIAGVALFHFAGASLLLKLLSILLMTPPPSSLPGIALMLGGVGYPAFALTLGGTLIAGLVSQKVSGTGAFGVMLVIGCVVPFIAAQRFRKTKPSKARSLGEKWGFLSVLAMSLFAFATSFRVAPGSFSSLNEFSSTALLIPPLALLIFKVIGFITSFLFCPNDSSRRIDTYLGHGTVNIVLLGAVLGAGSQLAAGPAQVLSLTLSVFLFILFDERLLQILFEREFRSGRTSALQGSIPLNLSPVA